MAFVTKVKAALPKNKKLLLAVSGGLDSMVMLDLLCQFSKELKLDLSVAHVEHGIRAESRLDVELVSQVAEKNKLKFFLHCCSEPPQTNIEAWGREQRYAFFNNLLIQHDFDWILTAHHADDQAETLLMKLCSNRELICIQDRDEKRKILRPMIHCSRREIADYAQEKQVVHLEDSSNQSLDFLRNRVRHQAIPALKKVFGDNLAEHLADQASRLNEDSTALYGQIEEQELGLSNLKEQVVELPQAIAWRLIEACLLKELGFKIGRPAALRALDVVRNKALAAELPSGYRLSRSKGQLILSPAAKDDNL